MDPAEEPRKTKKRRKRRGESMAMQEGRCGYGGKLEGVAMAEEKAHGRQGRPPSGLFD